MRLSYAEIAEDRQPALVEHVRETIDSYIQHATHSPTPPEWSPKVILDRHVMGFSVKGIDLEGLDIANIPADLRLEIKNAAISAIASARQPLVTLIT